MFPHPWFVRMVLMACLLAAIALLGCAKGKSVLPPFGQGQQRSVSEGQGPSAPADLRQRYQAAEKALLNSEFDVAAQGFNQVLSSPDASAGLQRMALFGRTAARLAGAADTKQYGQALEEWRVWVKQSPADAKENTENPALLTPLLEQRREALARLKRQAPGKAGQAGALRAAQEKIGALSSQTELQAQELTILKAKNRELLEKIRALEALQQEIDIKRKGITTQ